MNPNSKNSPQNPLKAVIWSAVSTKKQAADEKESLPAQEREALAICETNGWQVVDILRVPGHTRRARNIDRLAAEARREGIEAFDRLIAHWDACDFDVLVVKDATRFARSQSTAAEVVEATIQESGARIYAWASGGMIDESTMRGFIALSGYASAVEMDNLRSRQQVGYAGRTKRGLPTNQMLPFSHLLQRDPQTGKAQHIILDESKRRLFDDFATLLLEGLSWRFIERDLYERFGHTRPDGTPYKKYAFYHVAHNPYFWGHSARNHKNIKLANGQKTDLWCFDETFPVPEGVTVKRHNHPAVFTGELAERVKAELRRRRMVIRGSARPSRTHKFTGLLVCAYCGFSVVFQSDATYCCRSKYSARARRGCEVTRCISARKIQRSINPLLQRLIETGSVHALFENSTPDPAARIDALVKEIEATEDQIRRLIGKQAAAPDSVSTLYDEQISAFGEQLKILKVNLNEAQRQSYQHDTAGAQLAADELIAMGVEDFWKQDDTRINQLLHRLFGMRRLMMKDNAIIGVAFPSGT